MALESNTIGAAVVEHRHLAEGVELEELGRLVRALHQVDLDQFVGQAHQRQRQMHAVRVARQRVAVEFERGSHEFFQWDVWGSRASEGQPAPANERGGRRKRCATVTVPPRGATRNPRRSQGCLPDFAMIGRQRATPRLRPQMSSVAPYPCHGIAKTQDTRAQHFGIECEMTVKPTRDVTQNCRIPFDRVRVDGGHGAAAAT